MTLEGTPEIVSQAGIRDLEVLDDAETANRHAQELRERHGVRAIVVLLPEGGAQAAPFGVNSCNGISGPIVDIVTRTSRAVDLFVTGHTHQPYSCVIDGRHVTSASSFGRLVTDLDLTLDRRSRDVVAVRANNRVIGPGRRARSGPDGADRALQRARRWPTARSGGSARRSRAPTTTRARTGPATSSPTPSWRRPAAPAPSRPS